MQRSSEPLRSTLSCATTVARAEALRAGGIDKDSCANAEGTRFGIAAVMHAASTLSWSPTVRSAIHRLHRWPDDVFEFQLRNDTSDGGRGDRRGGLECNLHDLGRVCRRLVGYGLRAAAYRR